ncbi:hypothetical protein ACWENA_08370 [Streptomyces sp. NPDC004779]
MTGPSSNPRPRVDDLTDDDLDALHAQLEASEAATAMFKTRAEKAEADLAVSREVARSNREHVRAIVPELEKAERELAALKRAHVALAEQAGKDQAAVARVRALHAPGRDWSWKPFGCEHHGDHTQPCVHCGDCHPCPTLRALDGTT